MRVNNFHTFFNEASDLTSAICLGLDIQMNCVPTLKGFTRISVTKLNTNKNFLWNTLDNHVPALTGKEDRLWLPQTAASNHWRLFVLTLNVKTMAPLSVRRPGSATKAEWIFMGHKSLSGYLPLSNLLPMNLASCTVWLIMSSLTAVNKRTACMSG